MFTDNLARILDEFSHLPPMFSPNDRHTNKRRRNATDNSFRVVQMARQMMEEIDAVAADPVGMSGEAYYELGLAYACGRTQPMDLVSAHKWFNVAMMQGYRPAAERRAELAFEMTADEIAAALRQARAFITRH